MIWINPRKAFCLRARVLYLILSIGLLSSELSKLLLLTEMSWADAWGYVLRRSDEDWRLVLMYSGDPDQGGDGGRQTLSKLWHSLFTWPDSMANTPQHQRVALTDHINNTRISSVSQIPTSRTHPDINKIQTNISKATQKRPQWCIGWAFVTTS